MKKILNLLLLFIISFLFVNNVNANTINKISMDIYVDSNGDATIKESWNYYSNKNTEIYHSYYNLGNAYITDFSADDSTGVKYTSKTWDVDDSFNEKAYHYGYNYANKGVELCVGISHYGTYTYNLYYKINGFVAELDDAQVIYWNLIPPSTESLKSYYVKIYSDFNYSKDLDVWGYGKYGAYAYVYDGYIELTADDEMDSDEYVTVLVKFPDKTFNTSNIVNKSFDTILNMANEGAEVYKEKDASWIGILCTIIPYAVIFICVFSAAKSTSMSKKKIAIKEIPKGDIPIFRDLPYQENIFKAYFVANEYSLTRNQTDFLGSVLLKWIKEDLVSVSEQESKILKSKTNIIRFNKIPADCQFDNDCESKMYIMMYTASKDGNLEKGEFEKYCNAHYSKLFSWFDEVIDQEFDKIKNIEAVMENNDKNKWKHKYKATNELNEKALQMAGLKRFFKEFGSMSEKHPIEVKLWREYLMYAQIFGLANTVAKEFKKLYPNEILENDINTVIWIHSFSNSSISAASVARSRAQSYSSGGGGFSSGGGGGGSFGGGGSIGSR